MWAAIAAVLVVLWLLGFIVMHVSSFLIHLLLLGALVFLVLQFMKRRGGA
jgi:hypothetical protein